MTSAFVGKVIDNYRIIENLGIGGMGVVFKAIHIKLEKLFALKMIAPGLALNENFIKRFQTEAKALARLEDPNIVRIYDFRSFDDQWFIVMEYVEGMNILDRLRKEGAFRWQEAIPIIKKVLSAIGHAHDNDIIHRDIKPNNIILSQDGVVKVTDFGLAKDHTSISNTMTVASGGTLYYMSPEHLKGFSYTDKRSDIYSIGMTLYEMLTAEVPFKNIDSDFDLREAIVRKPVEKPSTIIPDIPEAVETLVMKAIAKEPERRYQSIQEMLNDVAVIEKSMEVVSDSAATSDTEKDTLQKKSGSSEQSSLFREKLTTVFSLFRNLSFVQKAIILSPVVLILIVLLMTFFSQGERPEITTGNQTELSSMSISSEPSGALVFLNTDSLGTTPLEAHQLKPGNYQLRLEKNDYQGIDTGLVIQSGQGITLSLNLPPLNEIAESKSVQSIPAAEQNISSAKSLSSALTINSYPAGAEIWINNQRMGISPWNYDNLAPGNYRLRVEKPGYEVYRRDLMIEAGRNPILDINLMPLTAGLLVRSEPSGALIKLNGESVDNRETPFLLSNLSPGSYQIEAVKDGFSSQKAEVLLTAGDLDTVTIGLSPLTAVLAVQVRPWGSIYIDDQLVKKSTDLTYETEVPVKKYHIKVTHPTLGLWEREIIPDASNGTKITIDFNKTVGLSVQCFDEQGNPLAAEVLIDQKAVEQTTPTDIPVRVGVHTVSVKKNGYRAENNKKTVLVEEDQPEPVIFILKKQINGQNQK